MTDQRAKMKAQLEAVTAERDTLKAWQAPLLDLESNAKLVGYADLKTAIEDIAKARDTLKQLVETLREERDMFRAQRDEASRTALAANVVGPWSWMPGGTDGENDLHSMNYDATITMSAGTLRELIAKEREEVDRLDEALEDIVETHTRSYHQMDCDLREKHLREAIARGSEALAGRTPRKNPQPNTSDNELGQAAYEAWGQEASEHVGAMPAFETLPKGIQNAWTHAAQRIVDVLEARKPRMRAERVAEMRAVIAAYAVQSDMAGLLSGMLAEVLDALEKPLTDEAV